MVEKREVVIEWGYPVAIIVGWPPAAHAVSKSNDRLTQ